MSEAVQNLIFFAFCTTWAVVSVILYFRSRVIQNAFIRRVFHESDFSVGDPVFQPKSSRVYRELNEAMHEPQPDAESERLRLEMQRRFRLCMLWVFGFPVVCVGIAALIIHFFYAEIMLRFSRAEVS